MGFTYDEMIDAIMRCLCCKRHPKRARAYY
jgi:hypothetical protein